jgi:hypothetical protein
VSRHSLPERVSGQGFFNTEEERGPRWATEKRAPSSDEALQAVFQTKRVDDEQQANRKTAHAQIGLQLHGICRQQCWDRFDFQDNGLVRRDIGPESKRQRFALIHRWNTDFAPYPNAGTLQLPAQRSGVEQLQQSGPLCRCTSIANPMMRSVNSRWCSTATLRGPPWLSDYLRDKNEERMNGHAICTLPAPAKPLSLAAPKPSMAYVALLTSTGNAAAGCAYNDATPLISTTWINSIPVLCLSFLGILHHRSGLTHLHTRS